MVAGVGASGCSHPQGQPVILEPLVALALTLVGLCLFHSLELQPHQLLLRVLPHKSVTVPKNPEEHGTRQQQLESRKEGTFQSHQ